MVHCPKPFDFENCKVLQHANVQVCDRASRRVTREYARVVSLQVRKYAIIQVCNFSSHQRVEVSNPCVFHIIFHWRTRLYWESVQLGNTLDQFSVSFSYLSARDK